MLWRRLEDLGHLGVRRRGESGELAIEHGPPAVELREKLGELVLQVPPGVRVRDRHGEVPLVPLHLEAVPELFDPDKQVRMKMDLRVQRRRRRRGEEENEAEGVRQVTGSIIRLARVLVEDDL
jgi:hypothetical protein